MRAGERLDARENQELPQSGPNDTVAHDADATATELPAADSEARFILVSDLDDTLKLTNVASTLDALENAFWNVDAFAGAARFVEAVHKNPAFGGWHVLSGSPEFIEDQVWGFLDYNAFVSPLDLHLKDDLLSETKLHKLNVLNHLLMSTTYSFLLIGDDTEHDPQIYEQIRRRYPKRVLAIYIRNVAGAENSFRDQRRFQTMFDIARYEVAEGRMGVGEAITIGQAILNSAPELVQPEFVSCSFPSEISGEADVRLLGIQSEIRRIQSLQCQ